MQALPNLMPILLRSQLFLLLRFFANGAAKCVRDGVQKPNWVQSNHPSQSPIRI